MTDLGIGSWPRRRARITPEHVAFANGDRTLTYRELADRVDALASALAVRGVREGDRVAHVGTNHIATFETFFATAHLGAIFVPVNTRLAPVEIGDILVDCAPRITVCGPEFAPPLTTGQSAGQVVVIDPHELPTGAEAFEALVDSGAGERPDTEVGFADDALILYTSGTTGRPKGVVLTHGNLVFNTINQLAHLDVLSTDVVLCSAPLFHALGLSQVSLPVLFKGGTLVIAAKFDPATVLRTVAQLRVTAFPAAPTMLQMMVDHPDWASADLSSLRFVNYGGSPIAERVARAWLDRGVVVVQGYGMTEACPGVTMEAPDRPIDRGVSAGVPHFFTDIALRDAIGAISAPPGQGELLVRGPNVFRGYYRRAADTEAALADGWYRSGDIVRVDADGNTTVVDRIKDMIISGAENIYPAEVEAALVTLPGVAEAAVVGVPDAKWGEVPAAYVVPATGSKICATTLSQGLGPLLARFKIPRDFHFVDELPRTASGKIQRSLLRDHVERKGGAS